jgi:hypothetical protein
VRPYSGEFGELETGLGHLAGLGESEWQFAGGAVGEFGGESGHGDLDRLCSLFVLTQSGWGVEWGGNHKVCRTGNPRMVCLEAFLPFRGAIRASGPNGGKGDWGLT